MKAALGKYLGKTVGTGKMLGKGLNEPALLVPQGGWKNGTW